MQRGSEAHRAFSIILVQHCNFSFFFFSVFVTIEVVFLLFTMSAEQTLEFIQEYRSHSVLWNIVDENYTNKTKRYEAYNVLATNFGLNVKKVKNKIKSLRSYFSKEHQKITAKKSGSGSESSWFAYRSMSFILDSATHLTETCEENSEVDTENPWINEEHIEVSINILS